MLTAPVLLSATPEFYNSTRLVFSSVHALSDVGISFNVNYHEHAGILTSLYPTFAGFFGAFSSIVGNNFSRNLNSQDFSRSHISYFKENIYEIIDYQPLSFDIQLLSDRQKRIYNITVLSSVEGTTTSLLSNSLSALEPSIPLMYKKANRTAVTDWVTVPLVSGRKAIYVADAAGGGADGQDGLSNTTPKLTVSAAYNLLSAGDHIYFKRGSKWTNQAFGGTGDGLPTNLCDDSSSKSGSSLDCPTFIGTYGDSTLPLPVFEITNSAITTFFLADNDDQFAGLKNFYVKCLHMTASGRDVREERNGDDYPSFFTLLNTGGSAVAAGINSADAHSDNILIEGCTFQEIGNAIVMNASYNSLIPGNDGKYNWGTSNFVSSYDASVGPACLTNILIRRNTFKDLYFLPAGSISRSNVASYNNQIVNQYGNYQNYHQRIGAILASQGKQPKAIYLYGASGTANMVDNNIFYRCGNKAETYPETYDTKIATVHAEGGFNGISVVRNIFYKSANIAVKQLDGGSNISNIYYRNPHAISILGDLGLFVKKQYQGVPTSETFPSVSAGLTVKASEGEFVPYWYFFDKNNALSIVSKNVIEEPQDVGYNISVISGSDVALRNNTMMTILPKSTAIEILGGTVKATENYIGNISKGISTGNLAVDIKGFEVDEDHFSRGASSVTHPSAVMEYTNKITLHSNVINNHGSLRVKNFATSFFTGLSRNNFDPSAIRIISNTIRNAVWNYDAPVIGVNGLTKEFGENYLEIYGNSLLSTCSRLVFSNNKIGFRPGLALDGSFRRRGINILPSVGSPLPPGEYSIEQASGSMQSFFGTTTQERQQSISSNIFTIPEFIQGNKGDETTPWLDNYLYNAQSLKTSKRDSQGWTIVAPYIHNNDPLHVSSTRIWYVDPVNGINLRNSPRPTGWTRDTGASLGVTIINGVTYEIGRHPEAPIKDVSLGYVQLRHNYPDWVLIKRGTRANMSERVATSEATKPWWTLSIPVGPAYGDLTRPVWYAHGNRQNGRPGIQWEKSGPSSDKRITFASYGAGAQSPLDPANTGNWFGSFTEERPKLSMYSNKANYLSPSSRYDDISNHIIMENVGGGTGVFPFSNYVTSPLQRVQNVNIMSVEFDWVDDPEAYKIHEIEFPPLNAPGGHQRNTTSKSAGGYLGSETGKFMWKNLLKSHSITIGTNPGLYNQAMGRPGPSFENLLFEDVKIYNGTAGISILGCASALDVATNAPRAVRSLPEANPFGVNQLVVSSLASGIEVRRCQFDSLWSDDLDESARSQAQDAIYGEAMYGLLVEDCVFDRVADKDLYVGSLNRRHEKPYRSNYTAHHIYFQSTVVNSTFRNNLWSRNCFDALQIRGAAHVLNNLFLKMPAAMSMTAGCSSINYVIKDNVMMNSYQMLNTPHPYWGNQTGGKFMTLLGGWGTLIEDNIIYRTHNPQTLAPNNDRDGGAQIGIQFGGNYTPGTLSIPVPAISPIVRKNIFYNWGGNQEIYPLQEMEKGPLAPANPRNEWRVFGFQWFDQMSSITLRDNDIVYTDLTGIHRTPHSPYIFVMLDGATGFNAGTATGTYNVGGNRISASSVQSGYNQLTNVQQILARFNDNTSVVGSKPYYPNPYRSLLTYLREFDPVVPIFSNDRDGETLALEYFMSKALENRKGNYVERYTATPIINYIREGFGKPAVNYSYNGVDDFILSAIGNLACNSSSLNFKLMPQNIINSELPSLTSINVGNPVPTGGGEIILPPVIPGGGTDTPETPVVANPNYYAPDAELTLYNPTAQAITVVLDPEDPNSLIRIPARKSIRIPYVERNEALEQVVQRWNLATMIKYNNLVFRAFGSIPLPFKVAEPLETPIIPEI